MTDEARPKPENPISFRPGPGLRRTLDNYLEARMIGRSRFIRAAILEKLRRDRESDRLRRASPFPTE